MSQDDSDTDAILLHNTESWLRVQYPHDVMMPCAKGTKRPLYMHRNPLTWSWHQFDVSVRSSTRHARDRGAAPPGATCAAYQQFLQEHDVGILLQDLCVVDVDDLALATELEERFPVLKQVPREQTRKGRHYFFERSELANRHGYYDGASQRIRGVDLKTRTHTGGAGFLVIAPSTDKRFICMPHTTGGGLLPIPDDLLEAVAVPRHAAMRVCIEYLSAESGEYEHLVLTDSQLITRLDYVSMFIDEPLPHKAPLPDQLCRDLAVTRELLEDTFFACSLGVTRAFPSQACVGRMLKLLHFMGASPQLLRAFTVPFGHVMADLDMSQVDVEYARAVYQERAVRHLRSRVAIARTVPRPTSQGRDLEQGQGQQESNVLDLCAMAEATLCELEAALPPVVAFERGQVRHRDLRPYGQCADYRWLLPHTNALHELGHLDIAEQPVVHPFVKHLLRSYPGVLYLAGGGALQSLVPEVAFYDYDLFLASPDLSPQEATRIATDIASMRAVSVVSQTSNAITFIVQPHRPGGLGEITVQLIMKVYDTIEDVLLAFDIAPCKVAVFASRESVQDSHGSLLDVRLQACVSQTWLHAVATRTLSLDYSLWSPAAVARVLKYVARGFDCFMPCVRRRALLAAAVCMSGQVESAEASPHGLLRLLRFEQRSPLRRPSALQVIKETRSLAYSGYSVAAKQRGGLAGLLRSALQRSRRWLKWAGFLSVGRSLDVQQLVWRRTTGVFSRAQPDFHEAFDEDMLAERLLEELVGVSDSHTRDYLAVMLSRRKFGSSGSSSP